MAVLFTVYLGYQVIRLSSHHLAEFTRGFEVVRDLLVAFYFSPFDPATAFKRLMKRLSQPPGQAKAKPAVGLSTYPAQPSAFSDQAPGVGLLLFAVSWLLLVTASYVCVVFALKYLTESVAFRHDTAMFACAVWIGFTRYAALKEGKPLSSHIGRFAFAMFFCVMAAIISSHLVEGVNGLLGGFFHLNIHLTESDKGVSFYPVVRDSLLRSWKGLAFGVTSIVTTEIMCSRSKQWKVGLDGQLDGLWNICAESLPCSVRLVGRECIVGKLKAVLASRPRTIFWAALHCDDQICAELTASATAGATVYVADIQGSVAKNARAKNLLVLPPLVSSTLSNGFMLTDSEVVTTTHRSPLRFRAPFPDIGHHSNDLFTVHRYRSVADLILRQNGLAWGDSRVPSAAVGAGTKVSDPGGVARRPPGRKRR